MEHGPFPLTKRGEKRIVGHYYYKRHRKTGDIELRYWNGRELINKKRKAERDKRYHNENKKDINEKLKASRAANPEKIKESNRRSWHKNKSKYKTDKHREKYAALNKAWRANNGAHMREYENNRYKNDTKFRIKKVLRARLNKALKYKDASKNNKTMEYVGCTAAFVIIFIEKQFMSGMTWENHGHGDDEWEIDHRRPCDSFTFETEEEKHMCFHYTNCQPMWGTENRDKSNKFNPETFNKEWQWKGREIGWVKK